MLDAAIAKLSESGLDLDDARRLRISLLEPVVVEQMLKAAVPALHFAYHTLDGTLRDDVYRLRVLGPPPVGSFGEVRTLPRYWQPKGTPVAVYYPQNAPRAWSEIAKDSSAAICITEGELKAASACKAGIVTLALGGVWSWCNRKAGCSFLSDLGSFVWLGRDVVIAFDSDSMSNHHIAQALVSLVAELRDRGARITVAKLPELVPGQKCGVDDFLVARGADELKTLLNEAPPLDDFGLKLLEFNTRLIYVSDPGRIVYDLQTDRICDSSVLLESLGNVKALKTEATAKGLKHTMVQVFKEWLQWPSRRTYDSVTYEPGEGKVLSPRPGVHQVNKWRGWGVQPVAGDITPWAELLDLLFSGSAPEDRLWFERWCAYPLQHPGAKLTQACGLWSHKQGVGKSLAGVTLGRIYGPNYCLIGEAELEGAFNFWAEAKQFVVIDDMSTSDSKRRADQMKKLTTQQEININLKFTPQYTLPDHVNYYITSNRSSVFYIDKNDRRYFVHEVTAPKREPEFYLRYGEWLRGEGPAALFAYLLQLDLGTWSPFVEPPWTKAKLSMVEAVRSDLETWVMELQQCPDAKLQCGAVETTKDLFTARELLTLYSVDHPLRVPQLGAFSAMLAEYLGQANGGKQVRVNGAPVRLWVVRNSDKWLSATPHEIAEHVTNSKGRGAKY